MLKTAKLLQGTAKIEGRLLKRVFLERAVSGTTVKSLSCLKSKYRSKFLARWVSRHLGTNVTLIVYVTQC